MIKKKARQWRAFFDAIFKGILLPDVELFCGAGLLS